MGGISWFFKTIQETLTGNRIGIMFEENKAILIIRMVNALLLLCTHRSKSPQKGKNRVKSSQKSKKGPSKARVVWENNTEQQGQATNTDAKSANADQPKLNGSRGKYTNVMNQDNCCYF